MKNYTILIEAILNAKANNNFTTMRVELDFIIAQYSKDQTLKDIVTRNLFEEEVYKKIIDANAEKWEKILIEHQKTKWSSMEEDGKKAAKEKLKKRRTRHNMKKNNLNNLIENLSLTNLLELKTSLADKNLEKISELIVKNSIFLTPEEKIAYSNDIKKFYEQDFFKKAILTKIKELKQEMSSKIKSSYNKLKSLSLFNRPISPKNTDTLKKAIPLVEDGPSAFDNFKAYCVALVQEVAELKLLIDIESIKLASGGEVE
jgi:hypothetical protein